MTKAFKTRGKYGYQPVILAPIVKEFLLIYLRTYRPVAIANSDDLANTHLFVAFKTGKPYKRAELGKVVSSLY